MYLVKTLKVIGAVGAGFGVGAVLGIAWGKTAKANGYGSPVSTSFKSGVMTVSVDTKKAASSGLPSLIKSFL